MVIGLLVIAGIPTTIGVCEALSAQKKANNAAKEKNKFHLTTAVSLDGGPAVECWVILKEGRLWIDHPDHPVPGHKFTGYYFTYPSEEQHRGLVSTIADDPPMLNWIFVDKDSHMVCHGGRQATLGHVIGPWYWTDDEQWLTLEGAETEFVAVEMENKTWALAWDRDGRIRREGRFACGGGDEDDEDEQESGQEDDGGGQSTETVDQGGNGGQREGGMEGGGSRNATRKLKWVPVRLHRKMQFGMDSRYVKGQGGQ